jgi:hypothetical protein
MIAVALVLTPLHFVDSSECSVKPLENQREQEKDQKQIVGESAIIHSLNNNLYCITTDYTASASKLL